MLAAVLRLFDLGGQSYWTDEAITVNSASWSWAKLFQYFQVDPHPPLHYLLVRVMAGIGGTGEFWLRLSSAVAGILVVLLLCWLLHRDFDDRSALVGGTMIALCPLHVWASQELRGMALAGFFLTLAYLGVERMKASSGAKGSWLAGLGLVFAFYTHYYTLFVLPLLLLHNNKEIKRVAMAAFFGFLPWLTFVQSQIAATLSYRQGTPCWRLLAETPLFSNAGHFPWCWPTWASLLSGLMKNHFWVYLFFALLFVSPIFILPLFAGKKGRRMGLWFAAPVFTIFLIALFLPLFQPKYLVPFLPFLAASAGIGYSQLVPKKEVLAKILLTAAILLPLISLVDLYANPTCRKTPWNERLPALTEKLGPQDLIVFYSATEAADVRYYLPDSLQTLDIWADHKAATSFDENEWQKKAAALSNPRIRQIVLVDLNGDLYEKTKSRLIKFLNQRKSLVGYLELQPNMRVNWFRWIPAL